MVKQKLLWFVCMDIGLGFIKWIENMTFYLFIFCVHYFSVKIVIIFLSIIKSLSNLICDKK